MLSARNRTKGAISIRWQASGQRIVREPAPDDNANQAEWGEEERGSGTLGVRIN